ncbi:hypothetical protein LZG74_25370 [Dyadobacter sp. CY327]|uniref:hypothetical protein n=1 Tax=Dyadobacter sp. CY327 TaxID=2907301 RepID=UPI001F45A0A8|nr:hypothetical protein [Dyadobacter sp. CY327]MCE7073665.1 hypothetical protein [Dyadobacter sp. CY327]
MRDDLGRFFNPNVGSRKKKIVKRFENANTLSDMLKVSITPAQANILDSLIEEYESIIKHTQLQRIALKSYYVNNYMPKPGTKDYKLEKPRSTCWPFKEGTDAK